MRRPKRAGSAGGGEEGQYGFRIDLSIVCVGNAGLVCLNARTRYLRG